MTGTRTSLEEAMEVVGGQNVDLNKLSTNLTVSLPLTVMKALEEEADGKDVSARSIVRELVAAHVGIELPKVAAGTSKKYDTPEARKKAQMDRNKARRESIKAIYDAFQRGELTLTEEAEDED